MNIELDLDAVPARLRLLGPLTIAAAAAGRTGLLQALQALPAGAVRLDLAGVTEADGAGVQLLLSTVRALRQRGHAPTLGACPDGVIAVAMALGAADAQSAFGAPREHDPVEAV